MFEYYYQDRWTLSGRNDLCFLSIIDWNLHVVGLGVTCENSTGSAGYLHETDWPYNQPSMEEKEFTSHYFSSISFQCFHASSFFSFFFLFPFFWEEVVFTLAAIHRSYKMIFFSFLFCSFLFLGTINYSWGY